MNQEKQTYEIYFKGYFSCFESGFLNAYSSVDVKYGPGIAYVTCTEKEIDDILRKLNEDDSIKVIGYDIAQEITIYKNLHPALI